MYLFHFMFVDKFKTVNFITSEIPWDVPLSFEMVRKVVEKFKEINPNAVDVQVVNIMQMDK